MNRHLAIACGFVATLVASAAPAAATPSCLAGTLPGYVGGGACTIGGTTFDNFSLAPLSSISLPIAAAVIQVTPLSGPAQVGFLFSMNQSALSLDVLEAFFHYSVSGTGLSKATLRMSGSS